MSSKPNKTFQRLPTSVIPVNYVLRLKPDLVNFTFDGEEQIELNVKEPTKQITLNASQINILEDDTLSVTNDGQKISIEKLEYNHENETVTFWLKESLKPGNAILSLKFTGFLNNKMRGFYRSKDTGSDGVVRYSAVTQFEATDARWAFPCWDEPAIKATFDISLVVSKDDKIKALSNMAVSNESTTEDGLRLVQFTRTPIMSTYLVAFIVGEFDYVETRSEDGVLVRVYTPIGKSEQGKFALDVCAKSLDFYKQYFQIAYPLNKMDMIAISDFALGAMENWGLVIYRGKYLLVDPNDSSAINRQNVALVIAHELAHQWFGNLVTMEWWTHLWLNEGFANFIEYLCVDNLFPQYNIWTQFVADVFVPAMTLDGLQNSHPIEVPVDNPAEVEEIFDGISYLKGASVIRMLQKYIDDEAFRTGLNLYLKRHSYKNTQTEDLWDALEEASKKPVRRVMSTWTKQKGYPVISVSATVDPLNNSRVITLIQEKFNLNGKLTDEDRKALWAVPISIVSGSPTKLTTKPIMETLLENRTQRFTLTSAQLAPDEWFKLNPSTVGTYRVRYSAELLSQFAVGIQNSTIPSLDRLGLLTDLFALVLAGKQTSVELFRFIKSGYQNENDYTVWVALVDIFNKFNQLLAGTDFVDKFRQFCCDFINNNRVATSIGWEAKPNEPYMDTLLRSLLLDCLVSFNDCKVLSHCSTLFQDHCQGKAPIAADLRKAVYRGVAIGKENQQSTFDSLLKLYAETELEEEKLRIFAGLGSIEDQTLLRQVLDFSLSEKVRPQDTVFLIQAVSINPYGRDLSWSFFTENRRLFAARYEGGFLMSRLVRFITENFQTEQRAQEVIHFFNDNRFSGTDRSVQQTVETIRLNVEVLKRDSESIRTFLQSL